MGFVRDCFTWEAKHSQISALSVEINTTILYEKEMLKRKLHSVANVLKILLAASYDIMFSVGGLLKDY